jgi:hypothetical protein
MSFIVNNSATNYTLYYNVLDYFRTIMENHPSIEVVAQGDIFSVDQQEYPQYVIGNVQILAADFSDSSTDYTIQLIVADKIKDKNNESEPRTNAMAVPFYGTDDVVDIHANTLAIINDLLSYTQYSVQSFDIDGDITNEPFMDRFNNGLAGWVSTFTLTTHNDRPRCLFELIPTPSTSTTSTTTTTLSPSLYSFYSAEVYDCTDCSVIENNVTVAQRKTDGSVIFGRIYHNSGSIWTNEKYLITSVASPAGTVAIINPLIAHNTCETACSYTTTTTTIAP